MSSQARSTSELERNELRNDIGSGPKSSLHFTEASDTSDDCPHISSSYHGSSRSRYSGGILPLKEVLLKAVTCVEVGFSSQAEPTVRQFKQTQTSFFVRDIAIANHAFNDRGQFTRASSVYKTESLALLSQN